MKFILASSSPRRRDLLHRLQTPFDIILPNVDESMIVPDGSPETYCTALAELKANDISQHYPNELVIGADTIVVLGDEILGKPNDKAAAEHMLQTLSGKTHQVYTGVCLKWTEQNIHHLFAEITTVTLGTWMTGILPTISKAVRPMIKRVHTAYRIGALYL